ncbi:ankyrin, partial [Wilcoxina mikolae CBS 423.85]
GFTTLHRAAAVGDIAKARFLIDTEGATLEAKDCLGWTPLHYAAFSGHDDMVRLLIELGADKESRDNEYRTPLHCAVSKWHESTVQQLVKFGANINANSNYMSTP